MTQERGGAEILIEALTDLGVDVVFGYPGGAVLPIYDAMFKQNRIRHILVRQEGGAAHAAEGYARSTGKAGVVLVTSGPGATNAVTGITDALMDSIPMVVISGQVPTHLIGPDAFAYARSNTVIKPQHAIERLYELTRGKDVYVTTEVGQHQMWAAQFFRFEEPNRWMTSGGLGTMGYGLPAAIGTQLAHPKSLVIDIAGDASILMNIQEASTAVQYRLPVKVFILNNQYMGMVRQWQQLLHGNRISESYTAALPDFVKLAEAYGAVGMRCDKPADLDDAIHEMIRTPHPVIFDCRVANLANCFPMIPSGKAHNEMLLGEEVSEEEISQAISEEGK